MITSDESVDDIPKFPVKLRETLIKNLNQVVPEDIMNKDIDDVNNNNMDEMLKTIQWSSRVQAAFLNVFLKLFFCMRIFKLMIDCGIWTLLRHCPCIIIFCACARVIILLHMRRTIIKSDKHMGWELKL